MLDREWRSFMKRSNSINVYLTFCMFTCNKSEWL